MREALTQQGAELGVPAVTSQPRSWCSLAACMLCAGQAAVLGPQGCSQPVSHCTWHLLPADADQPLLSANSVYLSVLSVRGVAWTAGTSRVWAFFGWKDVGSAPSV